MKIAWTTTETREQAKELSILAVENRLAACAQISGPITSIYRWKDKTEESIEYRITFKLLTSNQQVLQDLVIKHHPYDTPQWTVAELSDVSEAYRSWAEG